MSRTTFTDPYRELLRLLVEARNEAAIRQSDLADRLGKPQSYVSKYERGERRLDLVEFLLITRAIGVDHTQIIDRVIQALEP